jgi:DNA invertase Pin-like site-specific DNA recombinase
VSGPHTVRSGFIVDAVKRGARAGVEDRWHRASARDARRARGQSIGRPKALDASKVALAQRMHASGESASTIAATLGVSRATVYRVLAA